MRSRASRAISVTDRMRSASRATSSWVVRSESAWSGWSSTSKKKPSTEAVGAAARTSAGAYSFSPPVSFPPPGPGASASRRKRSGIPRRASSQRTSCRRRDRGSRMTSRARRGGASRCRPRGTSRRRLPMSSAREELSLLDVQRLAGLRRRDEEIPSGGKERPESGGRRVYEIGLGIALDGSGVGVCYGSANATT